MSHGGWVGGGGVVLKIYVALAVFQPYRDLEAGDNQSLKYKWRGRESNPGPLASQAKYLTIHKLALRQSLVTDCKERSFFANIIHILDMYQLPSIQQLLESPPTKYQWKKLANQAVNSFWTVRLQQDLLQKSSLGLCNIQHLEIRRFHIVWSSVQPSTFDVKKTIVKARMLTGVYILQKQRSKFNKQASSSLCQLCHLEEEGGSFAYDYEMSNFS